MKHKDIFNLLNSSLNSFNKFRYFKKGYVHAEKLFKNFNRAQIINKTIVFNTVRKVREFIDREFYIGKLLALNGAKVIMLLNDGVVEKSNLNPKIRKNYIYLYFYRSLVKKALKIYRDPNLQVIYYSDMIDKKNVNHRNWQELRKFALSSTIRYFQTSKLNFRDKNVDKKYNQYLKDAVLSRNIGEYILYRIKPNLFVTSHGIYSNWGPAYEFLKKKGVDCLVYATSHSHTNDNQDIYFTTSKVQTLSRSKFWHDYKNTTVTKHMEEKVNELFNIRINHKSKDTSLYFQNDLKQYKIDKKDRYKLHIAIFPSLIWDGDIADRHLAFNSVLDWLISTIDYLKNRDDIKLYLKFHPAEVTIFKKSAKIQNLIKDYLNSNSINNLELIPTEYKIDPYEFLKSGIDFGICYDGILALEMPFLKIPVLLGGVAGRFSVEEGNFTIKNKQEYFYYLDNIEKIIKDFHLNYDKYYNNIIRYSYWYLFENVIKLPTISKMHRKKINLVQLKKDDIKLDKKLLDIFGRN